jgi:hypothetical protein
MGLPPINRVNNESRSLMRLMRISINGVSESVNRGSLRVHRGY